MIFRIFYILVLLSVLQPVANSGSNSKQVHNDSFPGWPETFEGEVLHSVPLSENEKVWFKSFPGKIARFRTDNQNLIIRWVTTPTRKLHPVQDCLKATGYRIQPAPLRYDRHKKLWGCVYAEKDGKVFTACEQLQDAEGNSYSDISTWFWQSILGYSNGPWWSTAYIKEGRE